MLEFFCRGRAPTACPEPLVDLEGMSRLFFAANSAFVGLWGFPKLRLTGVDGGGV